MQNVLDFIKWGLTHVKKNSVPAGAILPVPLAQVGCDGEWEYLFGTTGKKVTKALLDERFKNYYSKNGWTRAKYDKATAGWVQNGKIACDCQGVEDNYRKRDTNADGNYRNYCTDKGTCASIKRPYVIGEAVFNGSDSKKTHVGWVCGFMPNGDVLVFEERGLAYGFVITNMRSRSWKYRGLMTKQYAYDGVQSAPPATDAAPGAWTVSRLLKKGCKGDDVKALQKALIAAGIDCGKWGADGDFGDATDKAVRAYQKSKRLTVDGVAGKNTVTALGGKWA